MRISSTIRICIAAVVVCAAAAGCTSTVTGTATTEPPGNNSASTDPSGRPGNSGQPNDKAAVKLGDLDTPVDAASVGAPFDPCKVGWSAFPEPVRPQPDKKPKLRAPGKDNAFDTACRYDNSDKVQATVDPKTGKSSAQSGKDFIALVVWSKPGGIPGNSADMKGSTTATFVGKNGWIKTGNASNGSPICTTAAQLANGVGGVSVTNSRFPQTDTCEIAKAVTEKIAAATP